MDATTATTCQTEGTLASLIIRSVGRPELAEALAAAGMQNYRNLEIIVVDATGGMHPPIKDRSGNHPVRFVAGTTRRSRPVAANAGLDAAAGEFIGFLDDDDMLLPEHVGGLVAALEAAPVHAVAFSLSREVQAGGRVRLVGNPRISHLVLLEQCFFPPCAALFRRRLLAHCRFDEALEAGEDWDFWLQVAQHTEFLYVAQETAIYRADRGRSAMTALDASGASEAEAWRARVRSKWRPLYESLVRELDKAFAQALACAQRADYAQAAVQAGRIIERDPWHAGARNLRGTVAALRGDFAAAAGDFDVAVTVNPDDSVSLFNLAQALERMGRAQQAKALYQKVLAFDPAHAHARSRAAALQSLTAKGQLP